MNLLAKFKNFFSTEPPSIGSIWVIKKHNPFKALKKFRVMEIKDGWIRMRRMGYEEELHLGFKEFYICFEPYDILG